MYPLKTLPLFDVLDQSELRICLLINRVCRQRLLWRFFSIISRLGNGLFWYSLMFLLPVIDGAQGLWVMLHMLLVSSAGLLIYKVLKNRLVRQRPFFTHPDIMLGTAPLDKFSFPSGHTLHAVGFSIVVLFYYPVLAWLLVPFTLLIALSRVVLGLHYPSDVLAGATIGSGLAFSSLLLTG